MKKCLITACLTVVASLFATGMWMPLDDASAQALRVELAARTRNFNGTECSTALQTVGVTGGIPCFSQTVNVPVGVNVVYVTMSATGDTHRNFTTLQGAGSDFTCTRTIGLVTVFCTPSSGTGVDGAPTGWIRLLKLPTTALLSAVNNCNNGSGGPGDCHDNAIGYTWCMRTTPGLQTFRIRMRSSNGATVFNEKAHYYIAGAGFTGDPGCVAGSTPTAAASSAGH